MNNVCPECESVREIAVGSRLEETVVKGVAVGAKAVYSQCTYCTREFVTAEQMEVSLNNAYEEYRVVMTYENAGGLNDEHRVLL